MARESYAVRFARKGGKARAAKLSAARRREISRLGARARWGVKVKRKTKGGGR